MRVIAGKARRIPLKCIEGLATRPTTDRIKETLFNIINDDMYGCVFLDLFSGSGAIGIEALSRGAKTAFFVEQSQSAILCIKENLQKTRLTDDAVVIKSDVLSAVAKLDSLAAHVDVVFMDPPYDKGLEKDVLKALTLSGAVNEDTLIIVEASLDTDFGYLEDYGYGLCRVKKYKTNQHLFIRKYKG